MDHGALENPNADELVDMSDSNTSTFSTSSSNLDQTNIMFNGTKHLVLDLHNLERTKAKVDSGMKKLKRKIRRKRKSVERNKKTDQPSSSSSDASLKRNTKRNVRETLPPGVADASPVCSKPPRDTPKNSPGLTVSDPQTPTADPVCKRTDSAK